MIYIRVRFFMKIQFLAGCIIFFLTFFLYPEDTVSYYQLAAPAKTKYTVGFSTFSGKNLSDENRYLQQSIPLLLLEGLDLLETHTLSVEQKTEYRKGLVEQEILNQYITLESIQKDIDKLIFEKIKDSEREKSKAGLEKNYAQVLSKISELKALDPNVSIFAPDEFDIEIKKGKDGLLLDPCEYSPLQYAKNNDLDLFFYGSVEEFQGYIYLEMHGFDNLLKRDMFQYKEVITPEEIYTIVPAARKKFIGLLLGRQWSTIKVTVAPAEALVFINGQFAGVGTTVKDFLKPGVVKILVQHPDYYEQQWNAELQPEEEKNIEISLEKFDLGRVMLDSIPASASVYVNAVYAGTTPIEIEKSMKLKRILLQKEEYEDYTFHIGYLSKDSITSTLKKKGLSPEEQQKKKRDDFYTAFGFFLVSVPFSIFLSGYAADFRNDSYRIPIDDPSYDQTLLLSNTLYISSYIALAVSGGLFIYMGFKLSDYMKAGDRPIG
jgi:hypothetical protein